MEFNDQEFKQLIKKSKRQRNLKTVLISVLTLVVSIVVMTVPLAIYYNLGPFQGQKIPGLPNNHLKMESPILGVSDLLFAESGSYQFNARGKEVVAILDYYQKDTLINREILGRVNLLEKQQLAGSFVYGMVATEPFTPSELKTKLTVGTENETNAFELWRLKNLANKFDSNIKKQTFGSLNEDKSVKIKPSHPYIVQVWTAGGSFSQNMIGNYFDDFSLERIATMDQTMVLYLEFRE